MVSSVIIRGWNSCKPRLIFIDPKVNNKIRVNHIRNDSL